MAEWTFEQRSRFTLQLAIRKALKLVGLKRQVSETDEQMMARTVADHIRMANYEITELPPAEGFARLMQGPKQKE